MIKISVIVPIYNGAKWLRRCLNSLVNQTFESIEIICINDCSQDNSLVILKEFAKRDKRIIVKNLKRNRGESVARNTGLKIATGRYIAFVDQDDYIDLDFYEKAYKHTKKETLDIVKGNAITKKKRKEYVRILNSKVNKNKFFFNVDWWSAIYKTSFLKENNIILEKKLIIGGDTLFLFKAIINTNKIATFNDSFYRHIIHPNSGNSDILSEEKIYSFFRLSFYINSYLIKNNDKVNKKEFLMLYNKSFVRILNLFNRNNNKKIKLLVCEYAIDFYKKYINRNYLNSLQQEFIPCLENCDKVKLFELLTQSPYSLYPKIDVNNRKKHIYVWGKGEDCEKVIWQCKKNNWNIKRFIDSTGKNGAILPEKILSQKNKNYYIIISSRRYSLEIAEVCEKAGLKEGIDFWRPE